MTVTLSLSCSVMAFTTVVLPDPDPPAIPIINMVFLVEIPGQAGDDILVFCVLWCSWERNHVTDVAHARNEEKKSLETKTESTVRG